MRPDLFAQVGLGLNIGGIVALAIVFSLGVVAFVMGSLGFVSVFSRPPRAVQGIVGGAIGLAMWCAQIAAAYSIGFRWSSSVTGMILIACGAVSIVPICIGLAILRRRGS